MSLTKYKDTALEWHGQESSFFLCPELSSYDLLDNWVDKTYCILTWVESRSFFSTRSAQLKARKDKRIWPFETTLMREGYESYGGEKEGERRACRCLSGYGCRYGVSSFAVNNSPEL